MFEDTAGTTVAAEEPREEKRRPVLAFLLAALAVGGIGAAATSAAWTDNTFFSGTTEAATFSLEGSVDGGATWAESADDSAIELVIPAAELADLLPGQTRTVDLSIRNMGSVGAALTGSAVFSDSDFTEDPELDLVGLAASLTAASGDGATDDFQLTVTAPAEWPSTNQGLSGTILISITGTATTA